MKIKIKLIAYTTLVFFSAFPVFSSENIRVAIADNQKTVMLQSASGLIVDGGTPNTHEKKVVLNANSLGNRPVRIKSNDAFILVNAKHYRGLVELRKKKSNRILVINDLDIEDYLKGVIAAEVPSDWEIEALKAQAVASRTYALYQKRMAEKKPYHLLSSVNGQMYHGGSAEQQNAVRAVRDTKGLVIVYRGHVIPAFYHASCGGHTENAAELWGIDMPYLKGVECECQTISRYGLWEKRIGQSNVINALKQRGYALNDITDMTIEGITPAGRVKTVVIRSADRTTRVPAEMLRAALGNSLVPSVFFELEFREGEAVFSGRGSGHGVGLCQWGAQEMARRGHDFRSILSYYYPGTNLTRMK